MQINKSNDCFKSQVWKLENFKNDEVLLHLLNCCRVKNDKAVVIAECNQFADTWISGEIQQLSKFSTHETNSYNRNPKQQLKQDKDWREKMHIRYSIFDFR